MVITRKIVTRDDNDRINGIILRTNTKQVIAVNGRANALLANRLFQVRQTITPAQAIAISTGQPIAEPA